MIRVRSNSSLRRVAGRRPSSKTGVALAVALGLGLPAGASAQVPPGQDWCTIETERARITFPAHLEALARRAAWRTETALSQLAESFMEPPGGRLDVLLTDHADVSNGFAQVLPSPRVTIYARPPADELGLGHFDDWLELVLTHEIAHIVHLDDPGSGLGRVLRAVFGRVPSRWPYFPAYSTPRWFIEGLATYYESELTEAGRVHGTFQEMQLRTAILENRFEDLGQASNPSPIWPAGNRQYTYGSLFFDHLSDVHGDDTVSELAQQVSGQWIPYRLNTAARRVFDESLTDAWSAWRAGLAARYHTLDEELARFGPVTEPVRVTSGVRWALRPRTGPDGTLAYVRSDARSDPRIVRVPPGDAGSSESTRVNGLVTYDWLADGRMVIGQSEYQDPYRLYGDLYVLEADGSERRVTDGARLTQPGAWAGTRAVVAVREGGGSNGLVRIDLDDGSVAELVPPEPRRHWALPSVSPDGRWLAATLWREGGYHDVVVLDPVAGRIVAQVTDDRAVDLGPVWSPDGRWIVWASDRTGILNVLAAEIDPATGAAAPARMLTNVRTGAAFPSVSSDGRTLLFSVYHAEGWDVARVPFAPAAAPAAPPPSPRFEAERPYAEGVSEAPVRSYSPFPTLAPRYWLPLYRVPVTSDAFGRSRELLGFGLGARTAGYDLVRRHAFDAFGRVFTTRGKVEAGAAYGFFGLENPALAVGVAQFYDDGPVILAQANETAPTDTLYVLERERTAYATASFQRLRWRHDARLSLTAGVVEQYDELLGEDMRPTSAYQLVRPSSRLGELRAGLRLSTARSYAMQIGPSNGLDLQLLTRGRRDWTVPDSLRGRSGPDRGFGEAVVRTRGYLPLGGPGFTPHVLAVQAVAGMADGPEAAGGHFEVGGTPGFPETVTGLALFGGAPRLFSVRGYREEARQGRYAWTASAEYRFPVAFVHESLASGLFYMGRVVGALFADAGDAWDPGVREGVTDPARPVLVSLGAELGAELGTLYDFGGLLRVGAAFPLTGGVDPSVYVRLGLPF